MARPTIVVPYVVALIAVIVTVDVVFFKIISGKADGEYRNCSGVYSLLSAIPEAPIEDIPKRLFRISSVRFDKKLTIRPVGWNDAVAVTMFL